jgi:eukaryotic-like serine/threonine-protein kinase
VIGDSPPTTYHLSPIFVPVSSQDLLAKRLGGRYLIERELGRGGMGAVYLARDVRLDRLVALKVLPAEFASQTALRERFLRETRTAASFSHPNIVPVYSVEEAEDLLAYSMAYVEGESLAERVKRAGVLSVREAVRLLQDVGYALAYAHGRGVVHRDIKPDNVMIERATGRALVMDFGIARVISAVPAPGTEGLTRVGEVVGTPEYMSPEQATGDHVDGRSDLYSLGLAAFYGVTGSPAVSGDTTGKVLARQITEPLPSVRAARPELPAPLAEAIERCAAKDPAERFQSAEALVEALDVAKLSVAEIPLAIRVFAQEAGTLGMVLLFGTLVILVMARVLMQSEDDFLLLPIAALLSVLITRTLQTRREAARLRATGFTVDDIHRGMTAVIAERDTRRAELRADATTQRARRVTVVSAIAMLAGSVVMFWMALQFRHEVRPGYHKTEAPGGVLVLVSMMMLGMSLALLLRSPFRAPLGERLFRLVWLGPIGRAFIRFSGGKRADPSRPAIASTRPGASVSGSTAAAPQSVVSVSPPPGVLAELESRVSALEKWRKESQR